MTNQMLSKANNDVDNNDVNVNNNVDDPKDQHFFLQIFFEPKFI